LILLGDPDQLPSVEAGDVLAAICAAAGMGDSVPDELAALLGTPVGGASTPTRTVGIGETGDLFEQDGDAGGGSRPKPLLRGHRVHLRRGYRQSGELALAPLAEAVREGDADRALQLLRGGSLAGVRFHEDISDPLQAGGEPLLAHWRRLAGIEDPAAALADIGRLRLLTALRTGPQGAQSLNARIEEALAGAHRPTWFHGRLLLVTENSYRHRLFNGDIGICMRDGDGAVVAWFPGEAPGSVRPFHPASLPAHESAFAMTVHKAQGSEFDAVWLQLPRADNRVLSRELVYTALTRARRELHLCADEPVLRAALARHVTRVSGLAARLAD
jgi:exodeoxyribonuclease V alpha subunit